MEKNNLLKLTQMEIAIFKTKMEKNKYYLIFKDYISKYNGN